MKYDVQLTIKSKAGVTSVQKLSVLVHNLTDGTRLQRKITVDEATLHLNLQFDFPAPTTVSGTILLLNTNDNLSAKHALNNRLISTKQITVTEWKDLRLPSDLGTISIMFTTDPMS